MDTALTERQVIAAAQAAQRDRRELLGLLSEVADSVTERDGGSVLVRLSAPLYAAIQHRTQ